MYLGHPFNLAPSTSDQPARLTRREFPQLCAPPGRREGAGPRQQLQMHRPQEPFSSCLSSRSQQQPEEGWREAEGARHLQGLSPTSRELRNSLRKQMQNIP